jgi:hypothetical protein
VCVAQQLWRFHSIIASRFSIYECLITGSLRRHDGYSPRGCVGCLSGTCLAGDCHIRFQGYICAQKRMQFFVQSVSYCCPILTKILKSQQILVKLPEITFLANVLSGSRVVEYRQTDRQTYRHGEANRCNCERAWNKLLPVICFFTLQIRIYCWEAILSI